MTRVDAAAAPDLLRRLRESRGWSWAELARALRDCASSLHVTTLQGRQLGSIQRAIARWESPSDRTKPGQRYQVLLAHLYAQHADGALALGSGSDFALLVDALRGFGATEQRIEALIEMVTSHAGSTSILGSAAEPHRALLHGVSAAVTGVNAQVGSAPLVRLQLALAPTVETCRQLVRSRQLSSDEDVLLAAAHALGLAARLAFETVDDETAHVLYAEAAGIAGRVRDRRHRAAICTSHAMVAMHGTGDLVRARQLAQAAATDAHDSPSHRARAQAVHAEVVAREGNAHGARTTLDVARDTVSDLSAAERATGFNADRLDGFEGLCAVHLGEPRRAHVLLESSLTTLNGRREALQRGIVTTDLARARLQLGDPAACAELLHEVVELVAMTGGRVPAQRLHGVRRELRRWGARAVVDELDEHVHERLLGR